MAACKSSSKIFQDKKNAERDGMITKSAIAVPFRIISFEVSLSGFFSSDNKSAIVFDNKNQRYFIFGKDRFFPVWQAIREHILMNNH